jgi:predicted alpha-1,2-mannosidase
VHLLYALEVHSTLRAFLIPTTLLALMGCESGPSVDASLLDAGTSEDAPSALPDARVFDAAPPPEARPAVAPYAAYVDPFIGTGGVAFRDIGSTHPGPQMPFGMVRPGPDTGDMNGNALGFYHCSGYAYRDEFVRAFSHTRMHGVGINDFGGVAFMPTIGFTAATANARGLLAHMDKTRETASVSTYRTVLDDPRFGAGREIQVETTATLRTGLHRVTFPSGSDASIVFDLAHAHPGVEVREGAIRILPETREVEGSVLVAGGYSGRFGGVRFHFVARFSEGFASYGTWSPADAMGAGGVLSESGTMRSAVDGGAFLRFTGERPVIVAVALSQIDIAHARMNLEAEARDLDFARAQTSLANAWEARLAQVEIAARSEDDFRIFYTALYHSFLMPTLATDVDGHYRGIDGAEHIAEGFTYYTDFSLWDTYRTMHPLITLLAPETQRDFNRSLLAMGEQRGTFPRWPLGTGESGGMVGDPAVIVLADSLLRGVDDFDVRRAYEIALRSGDFDAPGARGGMEPYLRLGYVTAQTGSASAGRTMEFAYADHAVSALAHALGESAVEARYALRARNYQNVFDPAQGFFVARNEDGTFLPASPMMWTEAYSEGNAWQYLWLAPQDPEGLAETLGGRDMALARLTTFFVNSLPETRRGAAPPSWYWQGNEPDIHAPYLFALWGDQAGTSRAVAWARTLNFTLGPAGLPGNDDSGTMSAWYLFSALGFFPIAGTDTFIVGSPLVTHATLHLGSNELVVDAPNASDVSIHPTRVTLDGAVLTSAVLHHADLADGATLQFEMVPAPAR